MNIESLLYKIEVFRELVIDSGFKRNLTDYKNSIAQPQNRNLVFMKDLSERIKKTLIYFENNSLNNELKVVLREEEPFTNFTTLEELEKLDSNSEITGQKYFQDFNGLLTHLINSIDNNEKELKKVKEIFDRYTSDDYESNSKEDQAMISLIFKDLKSTGSLKEFSKVIYRWNRTLIMYHTLLKSESPEEISLVEIQNGSIDVIFNIDIDIAIDFTELIKTGLTTWFAYLSYKSKLAKEIIASYMGNQKLIDSEKERESLMLDNIKDSVKNKVIEQHQNNLISDQSIHLEGIEKKADEVAKVITDHIVKGNEVKLLTSVKPEEDETDISTELREETATVREIWKNIEENEKQLLLDKYTIKEDDEKEIS